jgi:hypothetical protein
MSPREQQWVLRGTTSNAPPIVIDGPALEANHEIVVLPGADDLSPRIAAQPPPSTAGLREALLFIYSSGTGALGIWRALVEEIARRENTTPTQITDEINRLIAAGAAGPAPTFDDGPSVPVPRPPGRTARRSPGRRAAPPPGPS